MALLNPEALSSAVREKMAFFVGDDDDSQSLPRVHRYGGGSIVAATNVTCAQIAVVDGDTIRCDGRLMRLLGNGAPNVNGVDAPETFRARCSAERALGESARRRIQQLVRQPGIKIESSGQHDRFNRLLIRVRLPDGKTAGQTLIEDGLAVVWTPGYKRAWCQ